MFYVYGGEYVKQQFETSADPRFAELGKNRFLLPELYEEYNALMRRVIEVNDVISINPYFLPEEKAYGSWYKSVEPIM